MIEVERQTSKNGKVFRIVKDHPIYPIFSIEYLKVYEGDKESIYMVCRNRSKEQSIW